LTFHLVCRWLVDQAMLCFQWEVAELEAVCLYLLVLLLALLVEM
jgi:hypothetical protein